MRKLECFFGLAGKHARGLHGWYSYGASFFSLFPTTTTLEQEPTGLDANLLPFAGGRAQLRLKENVESTRALLYNLETNLSNSTISIPGNKDREEE